MREEIVFEPRDIKYVSISCSTCGKNEIIQVNLDELGKQPSCPGDCKALYDLLSALRGLQHKVSLRVPKS